MKRFLVLLVFVAIVAVVLNERYPKVHDSLPWLPHIPVLQAYLAPTPPRVADGTTPDTGDEAAQATGTRGQRSGRRGGAGGAGGRRGGGGPIPVLIAPARYADLPVTVDILGTVQATNTVTVRSQIDGKLLEIDFKEGQDVKKGDVLARIDPATYQAQYDQAVAKKAQDDSVLANAQVDLVRYSKLAETQYGSHQQADTQKALVAQTQAIVQQDQAAIDNTRAILDYATIRSPIDGRTGIRLVDQGNIVHASDSTGIVTVAQVHPISIVFNLPQQNLRAVNAAMAKAPLKVEALEGENRGVLDTGVLQVVDNTVDQTTGTVKLKGSFPNQALQLWPGQFVNIRLYIDTLTHVVTVPTSAVQRGPDGAFVYAVQEAGADKPATVQMRKVTVGRQTDTDSVITAGLEPPTSVVTTGFTRLTDGAKVWVSAATASAGDAAPADAPGGATSAAEPEGAPKGADAPATDESSGRRRHRRDGSRPQQGSPQN